MFAALALVLMLPLRAETVVIVVNGGPQRVTAIKGISLPAKTLFAWDLQNVLDCRDARRSLRPSDFWRTLFLRSKPVHQAPWNPNLRVALKLDDGRRIAIDGEGLLALLPSNLTSARGWKGPVRRLTEAQRARLVEISKALAD